MSDLPPGFVLDEPTPGFRLPPGFQIDRQPPMTGGERFMNENLRGDPAAGRVPTSSPLDWFRRKPNRSQETGQPYPEIDEFLDKAGYGPGAAGAFMIEPDDEKRAEYLRQRELGSSWSRLPGGEIIYNHPKHGSFSMNRPGPSSRDVGEVFNTIPHAMGGMLAAMIGKTAARRALSVGTETAADMLGSQVISQNAGTGRKPNPSEAVAQGIFGGIFGRAGEAAFGPVRRLTQQGKFAQPGPSGTFTLTAEARHELKAAGVDPDALTGDVIQQLQIFAPRAGSLAEAARMAKAEAEKVPVTRGDISRDPKTQAFEARIARGGTPGNISLPNEKRLQALLNDEQPASLRDAISRKSETISGKPIEMDPNTGTVSTPRGEAFTRTQATMRAMAQRTWNAIGRAYDKAKAGDASINVNEVTRLSFAVQNIKEAFDVPGVNKIADDIVAEIKKASEGGVTPITLHRLEQLRTRMVNLANPADKPTVAASTRLKKAYDSWADTLDEGSFARGTPESIEAFKHARGLRASYARQYEDDPAIAAVIEKNPDGSLVHVPSAAADTLLGGKLGTDQAAKSVARVKNMLGEDSVAWNEIKREMWGRIADKGAGTLYQRFTAFLKEKPKLAREIFDEDDIKEIKQLSEVAFMTSENSRKKGVINYGSAYELMRNNPLDLSKPMSLLKTTLGVPFFAATRGAQTPGQSLAPLGAPRAPLPVYGAAETGGRESDLAALLRRMIELPPLP